MDDNYNFPLVVRPPNAVTKVAGGPKRILAQIVAETLSLVPVDDAEAILQHGRDYYHGICVPKNYAAAASCFREAAEKGNATAQNNLGACFDNGQGVPQDYAQAVHWYRKAAEQGNATAQSNLGFCYAQGQGVRRR